MSSLSEIYVKKQTLETLLNTLNAKIGNDAKGVKITISLSDSANDYGNNVSAYVSQSKEQREAKKPLFFVGNGRTFWTKGETPVPQREEPKVVTSGGLDDFPF